MTNSIMQQKTNPQRDVRDVRMTGIIQANSAGTKDSQIKKSKIAFLIDSFNDSGGTEQHLLQLASGLARKRYDVTICTIHNDTTVMTKRARELGIRVIAFPIDRIYGISVIVRTIQFVRFLRSAEIDILQTYHFVSDVWGSFAARIAGVQIVISNRRDKGFKETRGHRILRKITQSCIDATICVSHDLSQQVQREENIGASTVFTIYNGVEPFARISIQQMEQKRRDLDISGDAIIIGSVMNFRPIKGLDYLIEAAKLICKQFPLVLFVCVGGDSNAASAGYEKHILSRIEVLQLSSHFKFLGRRKDVRELLQIFDYFILPSLSEGFSNALIEAMFAGKSIVATNVGGNPEAIISEEHGILVPPYDSAAIATALLRLLNNPEEATRFGGNAQKRANKLFMTEQMINHYDTIYQNILVKN